MKLLEDIPFNASPNYTPRALTAPKMIILHCPVGTMQSAINTFKNNQNKVSAHYVVGRDGSVVQMVQLTDVAWHAMHIPNFMSIGIEMQDIYIVGGQLTRGCLQDPTWYTAETLKTTSEIVAQLMIKFNIPLDKVIGHNDFQLKQYGNNHRDPGPYFPWQTFRQLVGLQLKLLSTPVSIPVVVPAPKTKRRRGKSIIPKRRK